MRVALVHDWLTGMRGGEKVLEAIAELYPDATIHTLLHVRGSVSAPLERHPARQSFVQWLPAARAPLPAIPAALSDRDRAVRLRSVRPRHQHEPLRGEVGGGSGPGAAHLLLPLADAVRVGPVRLVFRRRPRSDRLRRGCSGRSWPRLARWDAPPPAAWTAMWRILIMLRGESADTIIAGRPSCIPLLIQPFTAQTQPGAPSRSFSSFQRWCRTSGWTSPSAPARRSGAR